MATPVILEATRAFSVQSVRYAFTDPIAAVTKRMAVYTGLIRVEFFRQANAGSGSFLFPVVGLEYHDPSARQKPDLAILPIGGDKAFVAALATVTPASFVCDDVVHADSVLSMRADRREVVLGVSGKNMEAVVLAFEIHARNSQFHTIAYNVSVQTILTQAPYVMLGEDGWDGTYKSVGPILESGVPAQFP